jgi:hypothetical protein
MIDDFLSGSHEGPLKNHSKSNNSLTLWSRCRISAGKLNINIQGAMSEISIFADDASTSNPRSVAAYLHRHRRNVHSNILKSLPDQGKGVFKHVISTVQTIGLSTVPECGFATGGLSTVRGPIPWQQTTLKVGGLMQVLHADGVIVL